MIDFNLAYVANKIGILLINAKLLGKSFTPNLHLNCYKILDNQLF